MKKVDKFIIWAICASIALILNFFSSSDKKILSSILICLASLIWSIFVK